MANNRNNFFGLGIVPSSTTSNSLPGDLEYLTSDGKLHIRGVSANDSIVQEALAQTLTNKTLTAPVIATIVNTGTLTLPTVTDTLVGRTTTDTLTNKSISGATNTLTAIPNTALTNSSLTVNGVTISLGGSGTITATATNALTIGTGLSGSSYNGSSAVTIAIDSTVATLTGTQTLTNKTLTSPVISSITNTGTLTLPTTTDTLVGRATTDTLTNKSISGATNTLTAIPNSALTNSSVTVNGVSIALGASGTVKATATNPLTIGTGLTGTSYDGSSAVTVAIDSTVATLTGTQTLTNKTLTAPVVNSGTFDSITATPATNLNITSASNITVTASGTAQFQGVNFASGTISPASGSLTIQSVANTNLNLSAFATGYVNLQRTGTTYARIGTGTVELITGSELRAYDNTTTNYVGIKAPSSVTTSYTITLPAAAPATGNVLSYTGTAYAWSAPAATGITALTSDVSASGSGSVPATVNSVGGQTATAVATAATSVAAATPFGASNNTLVKRDGTGNTTLTGILIDGDNNNANTILLTGTTGATPYTIRLPASQPTSGQVLTAGTGGANSTYSWATPTGGSGVVISTVDTFSGTGAQTTFTLSVSPPSKNNTSINISGVTQQKSTYTVTGTSLVFSSPPPAGTNNIEVVTQNASAAAVTALTGDVTGTGPGSTATTVALVGGQSATAVATAATSVAAATEIATPNTLVKRDSSGISAFKAISLAGSTSGYCNIFPSATTTTYSITLPATAPATGTALVYNGTNYVWSTVSSGYSVASQSIGDGSAITLTAGSTFQTILISGTSGNATSAGFSGTVPTGAMIRLIGTSDVNTITITNTDSANGTIVNGTVILRNNNSIDFQYIGSTQRFLEVARNF